MKRIQKKCAGWDCISGPCTHEPKCGGENDPGNHGRHGEEWRYAVVSADGRSATSLQVYTSRMPACTPPSIFTLEGPRGADLTTCTDLPWELEQVRTGKVADGDRPCLYMLRPCATWRTTSLGAHDFFRDHGDKSGPEQPESFWRALERLHVELDAKLREEHAEAAKKRRCSACDGTGLEDA